MTGTCRPICARRVPGFAIWPGPAMFSGPGGPAGPFRCGARRPRRWCGRLDPGGTVSCWCCCGSAVLRVGEALGLRRSDLHLVPAAAALGCAVPGPHLHVVGRDNPNRARAKSGDRAVPVRAEVLSCYDRYLAERDACPAAEGCDFVLVNLRHQPLGQAMSTDTVRKWLAALSARAGLERAVTPHMFRHATATELLARGASIDVVKELLGHASIRSTEVYLHPDADAQRAAVDRLGPLGFGAGHAVRPLRQTAARHRGEPGRGPARPGDRLPAARLAGWDPATQTLAPDRGHPLLGYPVCRVAGCELEAWDRGRTVHRMPRSLSCERRDRCRGLLPGRGQPQEPFA